MKYLSPEELFIDVSSGDYSNAEINSLLNKLTPADAKEIKESIESWKGSKPTSSDELAIHDGIDKLQKLNNKRLSSNLNRMAKNLTANRDYTNAKKELDDAFNIIKNEMNKKFNNDEYSLEKIKSKCGEIILLAKRP